MKHIKSFEGINNFADELKVGDYFYFHKPYKLGYSEDQEVILQVKSLEIPEGPEYEWSKGRGLEFILVSPVLWRGKSDITHLDSVIEWEKYDNSFNFPLDINQINNKGKLLKDLSVEDWDEIDLFIGVNRYNL